MSVLGGLILKSGGGFTPLDLGVKLLNWWDGTIVDDGTIPGEVDNWKDQKGTIDWINNGNKATYDSVNNKIVFTAANSEYLTSNANVGQFNRSTGEYWLVFDYVVSTGIKPLFTINSGNNKIYFAIWIFNGKLYVDIRTGGLSKYWWGLVLLAGKKIVRVKQDGAAIKIEVNGVDVTSSNSIGIGWESTPVGLNKVQLNASLRSTIDISNNQLHSFLRSGNVLTNDEATNLYNYLDAKY